MNWKDLVKIALVGTDRITVSKEVIEGLKQLGITPDKDVAKMILEGASIETMMRKAGSSFALWTDTISSDEKEEDKAPVSSQICSARSSAHLQAILFGAYKKVLPEFIHHLVLHQKRLPPELLPELLDLARAKMEFRSLLAPCILNRGKWLIAQHPDWKGMYQLLDEEEWETGRKEERIALIQHLRAIDPDTARSILESSWKEENTKSKKAFLSVLSIGLTKNDETFLENCLDEGKRGIRKQAAELLAKISNSQFNNRMQQRIETFVQLKTRPNKKEKLEVTLPENYDDAMIRDSIDPSLQWFQGGLKASRLGQMIALLPPSLWKDIIGQSPSEILRIFVRSDYASLLIQALMEASKLHKDDTWMSLLLHFWLDNYDKARWKNLEMQDLIANCSDDLFSELVIKSINSLEFLPEENSPTDLLLRSSNHPWSDELAILFINKLRKWILGESSRWGGWHIRKTLKEAGYLINPNLFGQLSRGWPVDAPIWGGWQKDVEAFLSILHFRKMMIEELTI